MKLKKISLKLLFLVGLMSCLTSVSHAQLKDVGKILQSSKEDANTLVKEYLKPFGSGFGADLNTGWTNTAKTHKKLGFDITVSAALAIVPGSDKTFDVNQIGLQELEVKNGPSTLQTINGSNNAPTTTLAAYSNTDYNNDGQPDELFEFNMPDGTGFGYAPAPQIKAGIGLIMDTDLMLRYVPKVSIKDYGTFQQFGVGLKHSINQWLPGGKLLPVDLSIMAGYTSQKVSSPFQLTGEDVAGNNPDIQNNYSPGTWDGQKIQINTDAFTFNALVGKTLPVISIYGGIGFETSSMSISTPGVYPSIETNQNYNP
ncbi:MAG TPA: DUF6588 family protein, partial [Balneolaceae bacterium]|nr:DUF6588 family protein [Balneolaceae bacterium]